MKKQVLMKLDLEKVIALKYIASKNGYMFSYIDLIKSLIDDRIAKEIKNGI